MSAGQWMYTADGGHLGFGGAHLAALQWARERNCPWDETTCVSSGRAPGGAGCIAAAREHGCPWNREMCVLKFQGPPRKSGVGSAAASI